MYKDWGVGTLPIKVYLGKKRLNSCFWAKFEPTICNTEGKLKQLRNNYCGNL